MSDKVGADRLIELTMSPSVKEKAQMKKGSLE
jgi:hypothetical protein